MITMSHAGSPGLARRNDSRIWRFARLRSTARFRTRLGTTSPRRAACILFGSASRRNGPWRIRVGGRAKTRSNSDLRVILAARGKPWSGGKCVCAGRPAPARLDRQALPALGPARVQHLAPGAGGHPRPETVGALALDPARLIRPFHDASVIGTPGTVSAGGRGRDCRDGLPPASTRTTLNIRKMRDRCCCWGRVRLCVTGLRRSIRGTFRTGEDVHFLRVSGAVCGRM